MENALHKTNDITKPQIFLKQKLPMQHFKEAIQLHFDAIYGMIKHDSKFS